MNSSSAIVVHATPFREIPGTRGRTGFGDNAIVPASKFNPPSFLMGLGLGLTVSAVVYLTLEN
jgi:hypothetical protein